jgi:hypothetical protein
MRDASRLSPVPSGPLNFDGPPGRQIVELHMWVVREGIRGAAAAELFDGLCQETQDETCCQALDAAAQAMDGLDRLSRTARARQANCRG